MLGRNRKAGAAVHQIGRGATFEGTLRFSGRLQIDGTILGAVIADPPEGSEVVVGTDGRVEGRISAATIIISGTAYGPIQSTVRLDVLAGARLRGDIDYRELQIQHGAVVEGTLKPVGTDQVALKLVANSRI
jgi:cytoskeletal protein CcmA (bactofilin family)